MINSDNTDWYGANIILAIHEKDYPLSALAG